MAINGDILIHGTGTGIIMVFPSTVKIGCFGSAGFAIKWWW